MRKGRNLHCNYGDLSTTSKSEPEFLVRSNVPVDSWNPRTSSVFQDRSTSSKSLADISLLSRSSTKLRASSRSTSTCDTSTKLFTRSAIRFSVRLCANGKHQRSKNNQNEEKREQLHTFSTYRERHPSACSPSRSVVRHRRALETPPELQEALFQV